MVQWDVLLAERKGNSSPYGAIGSKASPICRRTNGRLVLAMLNSVYLILREAAGTVIPSFSSTLFEGGVSSEEEDLITWASTHIYLGMFASRPYLSRPDVFLQVIIHGIPSHSGNRLCTDQPHLQVVSAVHTFFLAMVLFPDLHEVGTPLSGTQERVILLTKFDSAR